MTEHTEEELERLRRDERARIRAVLDQNIATFRETLLEHGEPMAHLLLMTALCKEDDTDEPAVAEERRMVQRLMLAELVMDAVKDAPPNPT